MKIIVCVIEKKIDSLNKARSWISVKFNLRDLSSRPPVLHNGRIIIRVGLSPVFIILNRRLRLKAL
jgi:hypothetical protein